jgi:hypothetical protein
MTATTTFSEAIQQGPLLCDGAMGTLLHGYGISLEASLDATNLSRPELVLRAHSEYLAAGADVIETNTFGANRIKLEEHDLAGQVEEIKRGRARGWPPGYSPFWPPRLRGRLHRPAGQGHGPLRPISSATARAAFQEQIAALAAGGG